MKLFLCGDVMTGRGIDQALSHPGDPVLHEPYVGDARDYVELAEKANGPIKRPIGFKHIWGEALEELHRAEVDVRIINLETAITRSNDCWPDKGIHYRMSPDNIGCLTAARIDACALANNHVLDWGHAGLAETLDSLDRAGLRHSGAGRNAAEAAAPVILEVPRKGRVLLFSLGSCSSGIPWEWGATADRPGVSLLEHLSEVTARQVADRMRQVKQPGDVAIASIHWGGNWGYEIPQSQITFAHCLIESGFDVVHGHSAHQVKAVEIFKDRLILYGCGDFINDYEGISGYEAFRGDLGLMYLAGIDAEGRLLSARFVPFQMRRFQLHRASAADAAWLCRLLNRQGVPLGPQFHLSDDQCLVPGP